ncbi:MAG TPA: alanyl-tRNA editing protein [Bryobacteraceae bacterium]|nr:alanyl-tRNA editing protein [Bryobacteraceae bacterium]
MTERLYYNDCYVREFHGRVIDSADDGKRVYLDRTAFYPTSGGQPFDLGTLGGVAVREVVDEEDRIAHVLAAPLNGSDVAGNVDWERRFDHMQQHTGQHLLSAVLVELYDITTVSFHMGAVTSTIDIAAAALDPKRTERVEERCAEIVAEARPVSITYEDSSADLGLRKASAREGTLRIVSIDRLDRSACGGTHVRSTSEIGPLLIRKLEKIRGNVRIEFVCGLRAIHHARQDFRTLSEISRLVSVPFEEAAGIIAAQVDKAKALEKSYQRLAAELAQREGRELYAATAPDAGGVRRTTQRAPIDDAMRARAQAFVAGSKSVFLAVCETPPSVLLAASADSGVHAGERVKAAVTAAGGRGGGNQGLAQGSVPAEALESVVRAVG